MQLSLSFFVNLFFSTSITAVNKYLTLNCEREHQVILKVITEPRSAESSSKDGLLSYYIRFRGRCTCYNTIHNTSSSLRSEPVLIRVFSHKSDQPNFNSKSIGTLIKPNRKKIVAHCILKQFYD